MTRMALTAATRLLHLGLNLRLVEQRGDQVDWACDITKQRFTFSHAEMADMIADHSAEFLTAGAAPEPEQWPDPETVTADDRAEAERRLEYVLDMHNAGLTHRPSLKAFEKQIADTAERHGDADPPKAWTVKRWLKRCGLKPHWRQLVDRSQDKGNRGLRVSIEQQAIINTQIDERYLKRPPISIEDLAPHVRNAINTANRSRPADDQIAHVGRAAIASMIALREPRVVHAARFGELSARQAFDRVNLQSDPEAPLDRMEIDHTRADLYVVSDEDGLPIGRPNIGFAIDRCTRMPFGLYIGFEPESVLSVMQILKNGIFPKTYVKEKIASGEWDLRNEWPVWGMPRGLVFDRGMAGLGHDLRQAALEIGIRDVIFTSAKSGRQKGAVERFFRTHNQKLLHQQRGTTFSNVVMRDDYDAKKNAVIPFSDLLKMTHRYLVDIYAQSPHAGLNKRPPIRVWEELIERFPSDPVQPLEQMVHLFTRHRTVVLRREGVRLNSIYYNSAELDAERLSADFARASADRKVLLRYDPADLGAVWIRLPHRDDRYLKVAADRAWAEYATGRSIWEHKQIRQHHLLKVGGEFDADAAASARASLLNDVEKADGRRRKASHATRRARLDGIGRTAPAGSDHSTTPASSASGRRNQAAKRRKPANDAATPAPAPTSIDAAPTSRPRRVGGARVISMGPSRRKDEP